mgnify:CR=1 FL=1
MKNECEPYLGMTTDYDDRGICDVELRLILPKTAWEDFKKTGILQPAYGMV